jgi:cytochrome c-type biogenesis protein CcmH
MANPHAGGMANPHGQMAAPAAGPGGAVEGTIKVGPGLADKVKAGDVIFLVARAVDAGGQVQRMPLAVDRLTMPEGGAALPFSLSGDKAMMPGTPLSGTIQITARLDRDGDAMTRTPGDIEGILQVTVPAKDLEIVLDKPVL